MDTIKNVLMVAGLLLAVGFIVWHLAKRSREPFSLLFRMAVTAPVLYALWAAGTDFQKKFSAGDKTATYVVVLSAACGIVLAIIWVPAIAGFFGHWLGGLFDGGMTEVERKPFYSIFRAKRSKGRYYEALAEVRKQLEKFPNDFEGHMLLAELQAENLNDVSGAEVTILRMCAQPGHSESDVASALTRLADWYLGITKDRDSAQRALEKIMELMPQTDLAYRAAQRIGHLAKQDVLVAAHDRQPIEVKKGVRDLGLKRGEDGRLRAPEIDPEKLAAEYIAQLEQHPLDTDAREKLAVLYAKHYERLDLAVDQLELMIQTPGMASKKIVQWLNLMVDLQVRGKAPEADIRATLQRIIDGYPDTPNASLANRRLQTIRLELNANTKNTPVHMGTYEQDVGLKGGYKK